MDGWGFILGCYCAGTAPHARLTVLKWLVQEKRCDYPRRRPAWYQRNRDATETGGREWLALDEQNSVRLFPPTTLAQFQEFLWAACGDLGCRWVNLGVEKYHFIAGYTNQGCCIELLSYCGHYGGKNYKSNIVSDTQRYIDRWVVKRFGYISMFCADAVKVTTQLLYFYFSNSNIHFWVNANIPVTCTCVCVQCL